MNKIGCLLVSLFLWAGVAKGQYFETGQDPASLRWRQINTTNFQLIYPDSFEKEAQRVAFVFEQVYKYAAENLQQTPRKISVVLHTQTVKSNALVAWAPKRIEFFTTPHQQIYAQDWLEQLAIHEFTHVMQMDRVQQSLPFLLKALLGEQAAAMVVGAYLPFWLIEGEAICNETAFSEAGRGRLPSFLMENKAQLIEKGRFSFSKSYLGSYADFVPNHYYLGYWLTAKNREKLGKSFWMSGFEKSARAPWSLNPLNSVIKKQTGLNQNKLYNQTFTELAHEWQNEIEAANIQKYEKISPTASQFFSYRFAREYNGKVLALRESLGDIPRVVSINEKGQEQILFTPGQLFDESFSGQHQLVIWSERRPDLRWSHADRSVICIFDIETSQKKSFTTENKVFAPRISPDLNYYAAVEADAQNRYSISVFDMGTGQRLHRYQTPDNHYFFTPCWNETGNELFFVGLGTEGKYLASWKIGKQQHTEILAPSFYDIRNPEYQNGLLYFVSSFSGIDNIYAIRPGNGKKYQISSVRFGAANPSVSSNGKTIFFSNYSADGFVVAKADLSSLEKYELEHFPQKKFELAESLSAQMDGKLMLKKPDTIQYESKRYSKLAHSLNFHSWAPAYIEADQQDIRPGLSVFSQNKLGTTVVHGGYDYDSSEKTGRLVAGIKYSGWYPVVELNGYMGKRASEYYQITQTVNANNQVVRQDTVIKRYTWDEKNIELNIKLPLNLSSGSYYRLLQPEIQYQFTELDHNESTPHSFFSGNYQKLGTRLYFHNLRQLAHRDLQSRWGQVFMFNYSTSPFGDLKFGNLFAAQSFLYFPGISRNHGLRLYQAWQQKELSGKNGFSDAVRVPRGYSKMQNTEMVSFASDYSFPIAYPDWSLGKLVYLKRLKATLFYDYAQLSVPVFSQDGTIIQNRNRAMQSMGVELQSDLHFLRLFAPIELGVRSIFRPEYQDFQFEMLFNIDFTGF